MTAPRTSTTAMPDYTSTEQQTLYRLRTRYQQDHDLFSSQELARLHFVRWLYQTGRLQPGGSEVRWPGGSEVRWPGGSDHELGQDRRPAPGQSGYRQQREAPTTTRSTPKAIDAPGRQTP